MRKRLISVAFMILSLLLLTACSDTSSTNNSESFKTESGIPINTNSEYSLSGKKSIAQMKGAKFIKNPQFEIVASPRIHPLSPEKFIENIKTFPTVIGEIVGLSCATVQDGLTTWSVVVFDIKISEAITQPIESDVVTCVTVCEYTDLFSRFNSKCGLYDYVYDMIQNPNGFFVLSTQTSDYTKRDKIFDFSDYADYCVGARYDYGEDEFEYFGTMVKFDDIRYKG